MEASSINPGRDKASVLLTHGPERRHGALMVVVVVVVWTVVVCLATLHNLINLFNEVTRER